MEDPPTDQSPMLEPKSHMLEPIPMPTALLVERWWQDWFPSSPVSRDSAAWNHAYQAKEDLKKRLA